MVLVCCVRQYLSANRLTLFILGGYKRSLALCRLVRVIATCTFTTILQCLLANMIQ